MAGFFPEQKSLKHDSGVTMIWYDFSDTSSLGTEHFVGGQQSQVALASHSWSGMSAPQAKSRMNKGLVCAVMHRVEPSYQKWGMGGRRQPLPISVFHSPRTLPQ